MSRQQNLASLRGDIRPRVVRAAIAAVKDGQAVIESGMKSRCPVGETHALYESIHATAVGAGRTSVGGGVVVGTRHAPAQEYGNRHNRAHPFVRPTAAIDGPKAEATMAATFMRKL